MSVWSFKRYCWWCEKMRVWVRCGGHDEWRGGLLIGESTKPTIPHLSILFTLSLFYTLTPSSTSFSFISSFLFALDSAVLLFWSSVGFIDFYRLCCCTVSTTGLAWKLQEPRSLEAELFLGRLMVWILSRCTCPNLKFSEKCWRLFL